MAIRGRPRRAGDRGRVRDRARRRRRATHGGDRLDRWPCRARPSLTVAPRRCPPGPTGCPLAKVVADDDGNRSFYDAPAAVPAGPIAIEFTNAGTAAHDLTILAPRPTVTIDQVDQLLGGPVPDAVPDRDQADRRIGHAGAERALR